MKRFEKHIFVCTNQREKGDSRGCCADKNSVEIFELFKSRIKTLGLNAGVRVNKSGCLDACEFGPVVLVYPEQIWYGGVTTNDVEEIVQRHIKENSPVERLMIKDKRFNKDLIK